MKIAIIGSGGAGLTAAWLLQDHHDITLFEKVNRLGGHADTVEVEQNGEIYPIDAGFEFFFDSMFIRFNRLLDLIGASVHKYPASATLYDTDHSRIVLLPPYGRSRVVWSGYRPQALSYLVQFQQVIARSIALVDNGDPFITAEQHFNALKLPNDFRDNFLIPFLLAEWCVERDEFMTFSAYNVVKYVVASRPKNPLQPIYANEVVGGTQAYIKAMQAQLNRTKIKLAANITHLTETDDQFIVHDANSGAHSFDQVIIATSAIQASEYLQPFPWAEKYRAQLDRIRYFKTTIAVHGDSRLMPKNPAHWSVVNTRFETTHSSNTIWKKWRSNQPVFRSWITYDKEMPTALYHIRTYDHLKITLDHFRAQRSLVALQGENNFKEKKKNIWLAGLYMHDIDCHESAIMSAVNIAQVLDPQSENLRLLMVQNQASHSTH